MLTGVGFVMTIALIIEKLLTLYIWIVIIQALLSWVRPNPFNPLVRFINNLVIPVTYRISRIIPTRVGMVDISPLILIVLIYFVQRLLFRLLFGLGSLLQ